MHWACYVALLPKSLLNPQDLIRRGRSAELPVAWFDQHYLHVTLVYLGWLNHTQAKRIVGHLSELRNIPQSIDLTGKAAILGNQSENHRLVAMVAKSNELQMLRRNVIEILPNNLAGSNLLRPFRPHISLGRVTPEFRLSRQLKIHEIRFAIKGCELMESTEAQRSLTAKVKKWSPQT